MKVLVLAVLLTAAPAFEDAGTVALRVNVPVAPAAIWRELGVTENAAPTTLAAAASLAQILAKADAQRRLPLAVSSIESRQAGDSMVPGARIELATPAFSGRRSTSELPRHW